MDNLASHQLTDAELDDALEHMRAMLSVHGAAIVSELRERRSEVERLRGALAAAEARDREAQELYRRCREERIRLREAGEVAVQLDHQNTLLVEQWYRAAASVEIHEVNHGNRCDAEQERLATIAESACRMLDEVRRRLNEVAGYDSADDSLISAVMASISTFLSLPGHEAPGLRAQVTARDRAIDAGAARIAELLAQLRAASMDAARLAGRLGRWRLAALRMWRSRGEGREEAVGLRSNLASAFRGKRCPRQ